MMARKGGAKGTRLFYSVFGGGVRETGLPTVLPRNLGHGPSLNDVVEDVGRRICTVPANGYSGWLG